MISHHRVSTLIEEAGLQFLISFEVAQQLVGANLSMRVHFALKTAVVVALGITSSLVTSAVISRISLIHFGFGPESTVSEPGWTGDEL